MPKGLLTERWIKWMNVNLNMSKEKSKSPFGWNSIKEFEHNKDEFGGWRTYKILMVSKEVEVGARGQGPL